MVEFTGHAVTCPSSIVVGVDRGVVLHLRSSCIFIAPRHWLFPPPLPWHLSSLLFTLSARLENRPCRHIYCYSVPPLLNVFFNGAEAALFKYILGAGVLPYSIGASPGAVVLGHLIGSSNFEALKRRKGGFSGIPCLTAV